MEEQALRQSWRHIMVMLQRRGYGVEGLECDQVIEAAKKQNGEVTAMLLPRSDEPLRQPVPLVPVPQENMVVMFTLGSRIGVKNIRELSEYMAKNSLRRAIIFSTCEPTKPTLPKLRALETQGFLIQVIAYDHMKFDLLQHRLVSTPRVWTTAERDVFIEEKKLRPDQLPKLLTSEALSQYLGLVADQVVSFGPRDELHIVVSD